jgi:hypothetical protein
MRAGGEIFGYAVINTCHKYDIIGIIPALCDI